MQCPTPLGPSCRACLRAAEKMQGERERRGKGELTLEASPFNQPKLGFSPFVIGGGGTLSEILLRIGPPIWGDETGDAWPRLGADLAAAVKADRGVGWMVPALLEFGMMGGRWGPLPPGP